MNNDINEKWTANNKLLVILLSIFSLFYFILGYDFIPDKFHLDSGTIRNGMLNSMLVSSSYRSTSNFFKSIGLSYSTPLIILILLSWVIFIFLLITVLRINGFKNFSKYQIILLLFFMFMYGFYFTNYSKDIIILIIFIIAINLPYIHKNIVINIVLAIFIYGYFFRTYWIIVGVLSLVPLFIRNVRIKRDLFYIFIITILFIIMFNFFEHSQVTNIRSQINLLRLGQPNSRSMINNIVSNSSIYTDIINYIYCLFSLFVPIQGLSSINMIIYYVWIIAIAIFCIRHKKHINLRLILILLAYMNIQALFEPDLGSVFRHQLAWFIVLYDALCINDDDMSYSKKKYKYNDN